MIAQRFCIVAALLLPSVAFAGDPEAAEAKRLYASGNKHFALAEFEEAAADFKEAYRHKDDPGILYDIAQCYRQIKGQEDAAIKLYRSYLQRSPRAPNREEVERKIIELEKVPQRPSVPAQPQPNVAPAPQPVQPVRVPREYIAPVAGPEVQWVPKAEGMPARPFVGGSENGQPLIVCRARHAGGFHPGKVVSGNCNIGFGGAEVQAPDYDVLVANGVVWVAGGGETPTAITGGEESGHLLPICRAVYQGGWHPGKVVGRNCAIGFGGNEVNVPQYQVLVARPAVWPEPPPAAPVRNVEAGPLWNNDHANRTCPGVCSRVGATWKGEWRTTVPNTMSVCACVGN